MRQLFLIVVLWGSIPIFFVDPFYGIVAYTMINIIHPRQMLRWADVGRIFYAYQVVCFLSWLINREKLTPEYTHLPLQMKLLWVLALEMILVTYTVAFNPDYSWRWTLGFIKMTVFCFVMSKSVNTAKKLERYYAIAILWFTLLAIWGIQQKLSGNDRMEGLGGRQLPDVNGLAAVVILYLPMAYYTLFSRNKWIKFFIGIPSIIILVVFIIYGGSRGAFLGLITCAGIIFLRSKGTQKIKTIIVLVLLAGVFFRFAPPEYYRRLMTIEGKEDVETGEREFEGSAAGRVAMWKGAIEVYKNHPEYWLLGVGMNNYAQVYIKHIDEIAAVLNAEELLLVSRSGRGGKELHNTYLSVLMGGGAVVFLTWLFLIFYTWLQVHTVPKKYPKIVDGVDIHNYARAIEIGIIGYCVSITFINMEFIDFFYWHLIMSGVIVNLGKAKLKREALELEDEEFMEQPAESPTYAPYPY